MNEFDLPCTDCGTLLIETTVPAGVLPIHTGHVGEVTLGVCPDCGARYYPDEVLTTLFSTSNTQPKSEL